MDLPIVCTLAEAELQERRKTTLSSIREYVLNTIPTRDGYSYHFNPTSDVLPELAKLVELERQCCQFLTFKIVVEPQQPICMEISGPPEAKPLIADFFGS